MSHFKPVVHGISMHCERRHASYISSHWYSQGITSNNDTSDDLHAKLIILDKNHKTLDCYMYSIRNQFQLRACKKNRAAWVPRHAFHGTQLT